MVNVTTIVSQDLLKYSYFTRNFAVEIFYVRVISYIFFFDV